MSTEEIEIQPESQVTDVLALSESMLQKERVEGVVANIAQPEDVRRFTNLPRKLAPLFAKMLYEDTDIDTIQRWEENGGDYVPPEMPPELYTPDWHLRTSADALILKLFKSISHLVEGASGGGGRVGFFGRRRG